MNRGNRAGRGANYRALLGSPFQIVLLLATLAFAGYVGVRLLVGETFLIVVWFVGAALVHDLVLLPLYTAADRTVTAALGRPRRRLVNYVRVPAFLSALLLLVWFPMITGQVKLRYERYADLSSDGFLARWLLITAALFACSALCLVTRAVLRRRATKGRPAASH
ncbi:hypothetical protein OG329_19420 [Streptomyces sp. NBC_01506]